MKRYGHLYISPLLVFVRKFCCVLCEAQTEAEETVLRLIQTVLFVLFTVLVQKASASTFKPGRF